MINNFLKQTYKIESEYSYFSNEEKINTKLYVLYFS